MSLVKQIADAVVDELNSQSWEDMEFEAKRRYAIHLDLKDCKELQVSVAPMEKGSKWQGRATLEKNITIGIAIHKKLKKETEDQEISDLLEFCEAIENYFTGFIIEKLNFFCEAADCEPLYDWEKLHRDLLFASALTLTFKGSVARQ